MADKISGKNTSLWIATTPKTNYESLGMDTVKFDLAVVGGGIAGILTAWMLQKEGLSTVIIEKDRIIQNTTGNTTAKLTSQHNLIYNFLIKNHGLEIAQAYGKANQQAIEDIDTLIKLLEVDSDFSRHNSYVYTENPDKIDEIQDEVKAAQKLGMPADLVDKIDLPFNIKVAIRFKNQAQFHPRKFLLAVASDYIENNGMIYENTEAINIKNGKFNKIVTKNGTIKAKHIVVATKYPFWRRNIFDKYTWVKLSYALAVKLKEKADYPEGMYINVDDPVRTMRSHPYKQGQVFIFGGESHEMTKDYDKNEHYMNLIRDVKKKFQVNNILYRWIAGDMMPYDRLPYIGLYPKEKRIYVITGFHAWGLTWAMVAAQIITDQITSRKNPFIGKFSTSRIPK